MEQSEQPNIQGSRPQPEQPEQPVQGDLPAPRPYEADKATSNLKVKSTIRANSVAFIVVVAFVILFGI